MPEGNSVLWWQHLEEIVRDHEAVSVVIGDRELSFDCESTRSRYRAFNAIYWALREAPHTVQQTAIRNMLVTYGVVAACSVSVAFSALRCSAGSTALTTSLRASSRLYLASLSETSG